MERRSLAGLLALALSTNLFGAAHRELLGTIDISKLIGEATSSETGEPVWGIAFSPDDSQLVIGFGQHWSANPRGTRGHVIVGPVNRPKTSLHKFDVDGVPSAPLVDELVWSPSGQYLAMQSDLGLGVFSLDGKRVCAFSETSRFGGFLRGDRMVIYNGISKGFEIHRADCTTEEGWQPSYPHITLLATCASAGSLALGWFTTANSAGGIDIASFPGHKVLQRWTGNPNALGTQIAFADSCSMICAGQFQRSVKENHVVCLDIETGNAVVDKNSVTIAWHPVIDAVGGDWAASTVYRESCHLGRILQSLDLAGCTPKLRRRTIWNVRNGHDILSWSPPEQTFEWPGPGHPPSAHPFVVTMASSHTLIAEGGAGHVVVLQRGRIPLIGC